MRNQKPDFLPKCSATSIGSLPFVDPTEAVKQVFKHCLDIPFWPQLPKRSWKEGMLFQFIENLNFLSLDNQSVVLRADYNQRLEQFFEAVIKRDLDYFAISSEYAAGLRTYLDFLNKEKPKAKFLKGQITGPFTFGSQIKASNGNSLLFDSQLLDAVVVGLALKAAWQVKEFKRLGLPAIIFIDEPYLACFGSGFTAVNRQDVIDIINRLIEQINQPDCLVGLHCCSNTDWSVILETNIDIVSFDAFSYMERFILYPEELKRFLARGGSIAWGIVPTSEFNSKITVDELVGKYKDGLRILEQKGLDPKQICEKSLITPSCGLGSLTEVTAKAILGLLNDVSTHLKQEFSFPITRV
jgi:methionine synthase II (cobalamin-independent)